MNAPDNAPQNTVSFLKKIPQAAWLLLASAAGAALALTAVGIFFPNANQIKIGFPDGRLELSVEQNDVLEHQSLLETLFSKEFTRPAVVAWLKENAGLYHIEDAELVDTLSGLIPAQGDETLATYTERISELIEDNLLLRDLRAKAERHDPPFQHVGKIVRVGVPSSELSTRYIYVAIGSEFVGKRILLKNPTNGKELIRDGRGGFHKVDNVDFHLHRQLAGQLFGRVTLSTVKGLAFILPAEVGTSDIAASEGRVPVQQTRLDAQGAPSAPTRKR